MGFIRNISNILSGKIAHLNKIAKPLAENTWSKIKEISEAHSILREIMTLGFVNAYGLLEYELLDTDPKYSEIGKRIKELDENMFAEMFRLLFITSIHVYICSSEYRRFVRKLLPEEMIWSEASELMRVKKDEITKVLVRLKVLKEGHFSWVYGKMCEMVGVSPSAPALLTFESGAIESYCSLVDSLRERLQGRIADT